MYNRYIPQADGSYRRNPAQESRPQRPPAPPPLRQPAPPTQPVPPPLPQQSPSQPQHRTPQSEPVMGFLRQLLPKGFDTGDLIIVLLLLLIAGDNPESRSNALLTLALYFVL